MSGAYYNENDAFAAAWLRELIKANLIAPGEVDERSIEEVKPDDLRGFTQCHWFAGIGVWGYALRNAGWADATPVWSGSCPCQGFSASGQRGGFSDKRHLWPAWFRLIRECRPVTVFGEQVASKDGLAWLDVVSADMEAEGYAIGAADICAAGFGAPHIRQRLYFVANSEHSNRRAQPNTNSNAYGRDGSGRGSLVIERADSEFKRAERTSGSEGRTQRRAQGEGENEGRGVIQAWHGSIARNGSDSNGRNASTERLQRSGQHGLRAEDSQPCDNSDTEIIGRHGRQNNRDEGRRECSPRQTSETSNGVHSRLLGPQIGKVRAAGAIQSSEVGNGRDWRGPGWLDPITARSVAEPGATRGYWSDCDWWYGRDGKYRPIGAGLFPLVTGATGRMGKLRGYGNALCAPQAQAFIEAYMSLCNVL